MNTDKMLKSTNMKKPLLNKRSRLTLRGLTFPKTFNRVGMFLSMLMFLFSVEAIAQTSGIQGDSSVCQGETVEYSIAPSVPQSTFIWSLPNGGGAIVTNPTEPMITIDWGSNPGNYTLRVTESSIMGNSTYFMLVTVEGDRSVSCNDLVHVSVDGNCQALIEPDMILEGPSYVDPSYSVTVFGNNGLPIPNATVTGDDIGKIYRVTVTHLCSGNTCWGLISVEDKYIPPMACGSDTVACGESTRPEDTRFPTGNAQVIIEPIGDNGNEYRITNWDKCGPIDVSYQDIKQNNTCDDEFYSVIYRTWYASDEAGNNTQCTDTIFIEKGDITQVMFPENFDGIANPFLECDAKTPKFPATFNFPWNALPNGYPSPYDFKDKNGKIIYFGTGVPSGTSCDHLATTFTDVKIDVCGGTYKILRKWRVLDWCSGRVVEGDQLIKVFDDTAPRAMRPPIDTIGTRYYACDNTAKVTPPFVIEDCSNWDYRILYIPSDGSGNPDPSGATDKNVTRGQDGFYYISDLPAGRSWIVYEVFDECGNTTECVTEIDVIDDDKPVAVCDEHTVVTLTESGEADIYATSVDQGSFDNCELDSFGIRRMTTNCGVAEDLEFGRKVHLCCEDVSNNPIMVVFRAWDKAGNFNDCMVEVTVQDKIAPQLECPDNITISCEVDYTDLDTTGHPIVTDECGDAELTFTDNLSGLDDCNIGVIVRRFRAEDESGRFSVCDQRIELVNLSPITRRDIRFPRDRTVNGCSEIDADPSITGRPTYPQRACIKMAASYDDDVFYNTPDYCLKIVRTWTVIDWCQYDVNNPQTTPGKWVEYQTIYVRNNSAPVLDLCDEIETCADGTNCSGLVILEQYASDDCTDARDIIWGYEIDLFKDGIIDSVGTTNVATDSFPVGEHAITWFATDECGNVGTCTQTFIVKDCKQPTPYCETGIVTVIMPSSGEIEIWANDFDAGSFDDCTSNQDLRFSFSEDVNDTGRLFNCDSLGGEMEMSFTVTVYVTDEAGNQDFCTTRVIIQANPTSCPNIMLPLTVAGHIETTYNKDCSDVEVDLSQDNIMMTTVFTSSEGLFEVRELESGYDYSIHPHSNANLLENVTAADLVRIQKHILGLDPIDNPYGIIAADIDNSRSVSAKDLVSLRRAILGIDNSFRNNSSWRFVEKGHIFEDETNPWPFPEKIDMFNFTQDYMTAYFYAIKVGDVTGNSGLKSGILEGRSNDVTTWKIEDQEFHQGEIVEIPVYATANTKLEGAQFTLSLGSDLELTGISAAQLNVSEENISWTNADQGIYSFVWFDANQSEVDLELPLFTVKAIANNSGSVATAFDLNSRVLDALAVNDGNEGQLELRINRSTKGNINLDFELGQNYPNPFKQTTVIPFYMYDSQEVTLSIFDISGKKLWERKWMADNGRNEIQVDADMLSTSGMLYYQLSTNEGSTTKRMILLN